MHSGSQAISSRRKGVRAVASPPRLRPLSMPTIETDNIAVEKRTGLLSETPVVSFNGRATTRNGKGKKDQMVPIEQALARVRNGGAPQQKIVETREVTPAVLRRGDPSMSSNGAAVPAISDRALMQSSAETSLTSAEAPSVGMSRKGVELKRGRVVLRKGPLKTSPDSLGVSPENGSSNGAYKTQTAYGSSYQNGAAKNELAMRIGTSAAANGLVGQAAGALTLPSQAQSGIVPAGGGRPVAVYGLGEEEVKILPSDEDFRWSKEG